MFDTILLRTRNFVPYGHYIPTDYFVFDRQRLAYISIPKVACTSIKPALMGGVSHAGDEYYRYMHIRHDVNAMHRPHVPRQVRDCFKFAFVRNPLKRLVSFYEDKVHPPTQHNGRYYFDLHTTNFWPGIRLPDLLSDAHFKSQYAKLFRRSRQTPDFIGHFENIERGWRSYFTEKAIVELVSARYHNDPMHFEYENIHQELLCRAVT